MSFSEIVPRLLYLGSYEDREDTTSLRFYKIRLIVCCCARGVAPTFSRIPLNGGEKEYIKKDQFLEILQSGNTDEENTRYLIDLPADDVTTSHFSIFLFDH
jgi:hypothetical protein